MNRKTRSRLEMAARALEFSRAHPDESSGYTTAVAQLEELIARADQLAAQQRQGAAEAHAGSRRKRELRRSLRQRELVHLARAAKQAAKEVPGLEEKFVLGHQHTPYLTFKTMAHTIADEAQLQKDLLIKHGLVDRVLESLTQSLAQFDQAVVQVAEGRRTHIGAGVKLDEVGAEAVESVQMIDGVNRVRFAGDPDLMAAWRAASNVVGRTGAPADGRTGAPPETPPETPPQAGQIKPAA